jgi:protoheme IX farnesyltransferase
VTPNEAFVFGLVLAFLSVMTLGVLVNWLSGALLAFTIFFYAVVYTMWLKRSTPQNIVIGGAAGAFPPMIGWVAASNEIGPESIVLFLIIFLWTPPHFWALALFKSGDYDRAGIPMMPNVAGETSTKRQIFAYSILVAMTGVLPYFLGFAGPAYAFVSAVLGLVFVLCAWKVLRMPNHDREMKPAKTMFRFSLIYLSSIFAVLLCEVLVTEALAGA